MRMASQKKEQRRRQQRTQTPNRTKAQRETPRLDRVGDPLPVCPKDRGDAGVRGVYYFKTIVTRKADGFRRRIDGLNVEFYTHSRYLAVTGRHILI